MDKADKSATQLQKGAPYNTASPTVPVRSSMKTLKGIIAGNITSRIFSRQNCRRIDTRVIYIWICVYIIRCALRYGLCVQYLPDIQ